MPPPIVPASVVPTPAVEAIVTGRAPGIPTPAVPSPVIPGPGIVPTPIVPSPGIPTPTEIPTVPTVPAIPTIEAPRVAYADIDIGSGPESIPSPGVVKIEVCVIVGKIVEASHWSMEATYAGGILIIEFIEIFVFTFVPIGGSSIIILISGAIVRIVIVGR